MGETRWFPSHLVPMLGIVEKPECRRFFLVQSHDWNRVWNEAAGLPRYGPGIMQVLEHLADLLPVVHCFQAPPDLHLRNEGEK
jgi:hypothetical protein